MAGAIYCLLQTEMDMKELKESAFRVNRTINRIIIIQAIDLRNHLRPHCLMTMEITIRIEVEVDQDVVCQEEVCQDTLIIIRMIVAIVMTVIMVMDIVHHELHRNRQGQYYNPQMSTRDRRSENP